MHSQKICLPFLCVVLLVGSSLKAEQLALAPVQKVEDGRLERRASSSNLQEDRALRSNLMGFHILSASRLAGLNKKKSGGGEKDTSWKEKLGEGVLLIASLLGEEGKETELIRAPEVVTEQRRGEFSAGHQRSRDAKSKLETLQGEIQKCIKTTSTIKVATDLVQQKNEVKERLKENHPEIDWNSNEEMDSFIKEELIKKYKWDIAAQLQDENQRTDLSSKLEDDKKVAEAFKLQATIIKGRDHTVQNLFYFAQQADARAHAAWEKTVALSEMNGNFWDEWEKTTEAAKDAYHAWGECLNLPQEVTSNFDTSDAEKKKGFWLEQLKTAKVEPPLDFKENIEEQSKDLNEYVQGILLPTVDEGDAQRLKLLEDLEELTPQQENMAEERPRRSSSDAGDFPLYKEINEKKRTLIEEWERLAQEADQRRVEQEGRDGKIPILFSNNKNHKMLHAAWKIRDDALFKTQREAVARAEKEARNVRQAATWEQDNARWRVRARADQLFGELEMKENDYKIYNQQQHLEDEDWREEQNKQEQLIEHLNRHHQQARQEWERMAKEHPTVTAVRDEEERKAALEQLKKSDRVVVMRRKEFQDQVYQGKAYIRTRTDEATPEEIERCQKALRARKTKALVALAEKRLTLEEYAELVKREALKDAKDNIPGDREAWKAMVLESEQEAQSFKAAHGDTEESRQHNAIAAADRAGYETRLAEFQFLNDIQKKWIDRLEELAERRLQAACAYFKNDFLPWIMLSPQERFYYNAPISRARATEAARAIEEAEEKARQASEEAERLQQSFLAQKADQEKARQEKEAAYQNLKQLLQNQIKEQEQSVTRFHQEVERVHKTNLFGFFSSGLQARSRAIDALLQATTTLFNLRARLGKEERKYSYDPMTLTPEEQHEREAAITQREKANKEECLRWARLTPQERTAKKQADQKRYETNAKKARKENKEKEAISWDEAGAAAFWVSERLAKAIEAEKAGQHDEATKWREAATWDQFRCEHKTKAALAWVAGKEKEATSWDQAGAAAFWVSERLAKAIEAEKAGQHDEATKWREAAKCQELRCENKTKAALALAAGKEKEATRWNDAEYAANRISEYLEKAIEAEKAGQHDEAKAWREAAKTSQLYCEKKTKAALAWVAGKEKEASSWDDAGASAFLASCHLVKAIEAEKAGQHDKAKAWREAAKWQQLRCENKTKVALAWAAGKEKETIIWNDAGFGAYWASKYLERAIEAEKAGQREEAKAWREAARTSQLRCENKNKAALAWSAGKKKEATSWDDAGNAELLVFEYFKKAIEAEKAGQHEEAIAWREAAKWRQQLCCENKTKAALAWAAGKEKEATSWDDAGNAAFLVSGHLAEVIEAEKSGQHEEAIAWREAAKWRQLCCENKTKAALAWIAGKDKEAISWDNAGTGAYRTSEYLEKTIKAEKADHDEEAIAWREAAKESQLQCENKTKAALAWIAGKDKEASSWDYAGNGASWTSFQLANVIKIEKTGRSSSTMWCQVATENKLACDHWMQAAVTYQTGLSAEGEHHDQEGWSTCHQAYSHIVSYCLAQEDAAKVAGKMKEIEAWHHAVTVSQQTTECVIKASEASLKGFWKASQSWNEAVGDSYFASHALIQEIEARVTGTHEKIEEATEWKRMAEGYQLASECKMKAAAAHEAGNEAEGERYDKEGEAAFEKVWDWKKY